MRPMRKRLVQVVLLLIVFAMVILYMSWGSYTMSFMEIMNTLAGNGEKFQNVTIFDIRMPRLIVAILVAVALSTSGALLQTMTKNDLADPGIIGINAGAATAAVMFISLSTTNYTQELGGLSIYVLPFLAMLGALCTAGVLYFLAGRGHIRPKRLLLMGLGIQAGMNALIILMTFRNGAGDYNRVLVWISGSLWGAGWDYVKILTPVVLILFAATFVMWKKLDVFMLSDEHVVSLGLNINRERKRFLLYAVLLAGAATAFAGNIGFIGLVCPHMARRLVGSYHKYCIPVSAMIAVVFILLADSVSRNLFSPIEIPVGITLSLFGVPYFIYLLMKEN